MMTHVDTGPDETLFAAYRDRGDEGALERLGSDGS
jgi:hypothetical protein